MSIVQERRNTPPAALIEGVLSGNRLLTARTITQVENESPDAHTVLSGLFPHTGKAHIIGVTGAPGTGKSTLVTGLVRHYREKGLRVAVVAVDPTSPFTGGALLGDRVRMRALSGDSGVFIRSMATRGSLGGLSKTTGDVVTVLDAAGYDRILVETVGVGQAEVEIARTAHTTLVVEAPGMGDEVQAIKAGILEIGDILVVNKADRPGVERTIQALEMMLETAYGGPRVVQHHGQLLRVEMPPELRQDHGVRWQVTVLRTVAADTVGTENGIGALCDRIEAHRVWLHESGEIELREQLRIAHVLENILRAELNRRILAHFPAAGLRDLVTEVRRRHIDPYRAANELLKEI